MEIKQTEYPNAVVVSLLGRLDSLHAQSTEDYFANLLKNSDKHLVVDCSEMSYTNSSGLRIFIMYLKKMKAAGRKMPLSGLQAKIQEIFQVSGFTQLFEIYKTRQEALDAL